MADTIRFTATSAGHGMLGWLGMDDGVFDGTAAQPVANANVSEFIFLDPLSGQALHLGHLDATGSTRFNSVGVPTVVGRSGMLAGSAAAGVLLQGSSCACVGTHSFADVTWSTSPSGPIPEPTNLVLFGLGVGELALVRRRRPG